MLKWQDDKKFLQLPGDDPKMPADRRAKLKTVLDHLLPGPIESYESLPLITTLLSLVDHAIARRQPRWPSQPVKGLPLLVKSLTTRSSIPCKSI
jgi:hypothetical protein